MTHRAVHEWGRVKVGDGGFSRAQANTLISAARAHNLGGEEGSKILSDHYGHLRAKQCVGVLAAGECSLEILPKVDPDAAPPEAATVRAQLVRMLDAALDFGLSDGEAAALARQDTTLLDILIRIFADRLLDQVRQGLPRAYQERAEDLGALRGRLDVHRQFTVNAVRPDRLACRFDELSVDTPLLQVMRACVIFLSRRARAFETQRRLSELRLLLQDVRDVAPASLPWGLVRIDRSNRKWRTLFELAQLFLRREWQASHHDARQDSNAISLMFAMNDLFEATVAAALRRSLSPLGLEVVSQGGLRACLGSWTADQPCVGTTFRTKPDILIRRSGRILAIIDTKWKCLRPKAEEGKQGVSQSDVYQMMAYSQLYECDRMLLLYPHHAGLAQDRLQSSFGIAVPGRVPAPRLQIATVDVAKDLPAMAASLQDIALGTAGLRIRSAVAA